MAERRTTPGEIPAFFVPGNGGKADTEADFRRYLRKNGEIYFLKKKTPGMAIFDKNTRLTDKQERFCREYLETLNASEAYRRAYNCEKMTTRTIDTKSRELMRTPSVSARLDYLKAHAAEAANISLQRIIKEHARIAFSDATRVRSGWYTLKEFESLTEDERACIKSVETKQRKAIDGNGQKVVEDWIKVQVYDKQKALDALCLILGYNSPQKLEGDFRLSGVKVEVIDQGAAALLQEVLKR